MRRPVVTLAIILTALLSIGHAAQPPPGPNITGVYVCEGANAAGTPYHAVVEIVPQGAVWGVRWTFDNQIEGHGVGLIQSGVLAVIYQLSNGDVGLVAYVIVPGDPLRLDGVWTMPGAEIALRETLTKTTVRNPALLRGPRRGV